MAEEREGGGEREREIRRGAIDVPVHGRKTWRKRGRETGRERARALPGSAGVRRYSEVDEVVFENANLAAGRGDLT